MDGSCTGEHGIGLTKQKYMTLEFGEDTVDLMASIKLAIDPHNLMNPGKIFTLK
jgi:D-lactate dehydrogenase (cytochrome)